MYQMQPPQPVEPRIQQPEEPKRMSVLQIALIIVVIGFVVWYLVTALTPEAEPYGRITAGTLGSRYSGDCLVIRDETPYDAEGLTSIEYIAEEGVMIYRGTTICNVYSSGFSTREMTTLQDYRDQIKEYQIKLLRSEVATDARMEKLESEVMTRAREVRAIVGGARGNMNNQESLLGMAIQARQSYLKQKYSEDQRMTRLYDDEQSQMQRISSWTKQYAALTEGIVSFYSDGYEYGLTINNYDQFTPAQVRSMLNGNKPEQSATQKGKTTIYRMIRDGYWYVLMMVRDGSWNPVEGAEYDLKLESFRDTTVKATVVSFTRSGGEMVVRLAVRDQVSPILYIRTCTGELGDNVSILKVPGRALYTQDNMLGVVVVDGQYQTFIPVNVLDRRDGFAYISPIQQGVLAEGQTVRLF